MTARGALITAAAIALLAVLVVGLVQLAGSSQPRASDAALTLAQMRARLSGSPPPLASLHGQASELLSGGPPAVRGRPVVINKWASGCAPGRAEFSAFALASVARGRQVAFIGIDSGESSRSD